MDRGSNHEALIILMNIAVNAHMDIAEGKRKEAAPEKLQDAFDHLDAIGDALVQKLKAGLNKTTRSPIGDSQRIGCKRSNILANSLAFVK